MFRSSTSSSDRRSPWRRAALIGVGVLLVAEAGLRLPAVEAVVGPPDIFYHPGVTERLEVLDDLQQAGLAVDVLFVGSSVVRTNISPLVFDASVAEADIEVVSFNVGLSALRPDPVLLYLDELWLDAVEPRVVVQAVRYEDLADAVAVDEFEPFDGGRYEQLWLSDSPLARVQEAALSSSRLLQYAGVLTELLALPGALREEGFEIDERGFNRTERLLSEVRSELSPDDIPGGNAASNGYDLPIDEATFEFGFEVLAATIDRVEAAGATFVLVNMPEHAEKFIGHPDGAARYEHYVGAVRAFADAHDVEFVDLVANGIEEYADDSMFADFNHMTPEAAAALTKRLAASFLENDELRAGLARP